MSSRHFALCVVLGALSTSCFLKPKKKDGKRKSSGAASLVDRGSIFFDRTGDGDVARLAFKTTRGALCELALVSQDDLTEPKKDNPRVVPCANGGDPKTDFVQQVDALRTDTLYFILINAWEPGSTKEAGDVVTVKETPGVVGPGPTNPSPGGPTPDGKFNELLVARLNVPLKTAEFHRHAFSEATDLASIKGRLNRKLGCQTGVPEKTAPFREAAQPIGISNLATRDFAAGSAKAHPNFADRLTLAYGSVNDGLDKWTLMFQAGGADRLLTARPIARIANMEMESSSVYAFEAAQLAEAADPLKIDPAKPLKFSWTTGSNLLDQSYVTVQIGRPDYDKSVYCVFQADKRSAVVDAALLQGLDEGRHVVLAELATNQLWAKDGWLATTYDWRSGRIEK